MVFFSLEIRGMTAVPKGGTGKRDKFRKSVSRCGVAIYGPKHSQSPEVTGAGSRERIFVDDPRAPCLSIDYANDSYRLLPSTEKFSAHTGICQILGTKCIRGGKHRIKVSCFYIKGMVRFCQYSLFLRKYADAV